MDSGEVISVVDYNEDVGTNIPEYIINFSPECNEEALENRFPSSRKQYLSDVLHDLNDPFRTKTGADPPADLEPMVVRLVTDSSPVQANLRR